MAQRLRVLSALAKDLNLVSSTHAGQLITTVTLQLQDQLWTEPPEELARDGDGACSNPGNLKLEASNVILRMEGMEQSSSVFLSLPWEHVTLPPGGYRLPVM